MRVLLVRHAVAVDRLAFEGADADRPLTPEGARRFRRAARALAARVPEISVIASSSLRRARETADLLAEALPESADRVELGALEPDARPSAAVAWLKSLEPSSSLRSPEPARSRKSPSPRLEPSAVAMIGHEPQLSRLEAWLLVGRERPISVFKKGGAALLDLPVRVAAGRAALLWHLTASQLRDLAG